MSVRMNTDILKIDAFYQGQSVMNKILSPIDSIFGQCTLFNYSPIPSLSASKFRGFVEFNR
jgi:hypothetical protein